MRNILNVKVNLSSWVDTKGAPWYSRTLPQPRSLIDVYNVNPTCTVERNGPKTDHQSPITYTTNLGRQRLGADPFEHLFSSHMFARTAAIVVFSKIKAYLCSGTIIIVSKHSPLRKYAPWSLTTDPFFACPCSTVVFPFAGQTCPGGIAGLNANDKVW